MSDLTFASNDDGTYMLVVDGVDLSKFVHGLRIVSNAFEPASVELLVSPRRLKVQISDVEVVETVVAEVEP